MLMLTNYSFVTDFQANADNTQGKETVKVSISSFTETWVASWGKFFFLVERFKSFYWASKATLLVETYSTMANRDILFISSLETYVIELSVKRVSVEENQIEAEGERDR